MIRILLKQKTDMTTEAEWEKKAVLKVQEQQMGIIQYFSSENCTGVCHSWLSPSLLTEEELSPDYRSAEPWPAMIKMGTGAICVCKR